jgi:hypothetical protein
MFFLQDLSFGFIPNFYGFWKELRARFYRGFPEYTHRSLKNLLIGTSLCQMRGANLQ